MNQTPIHLCLVSDQMAANLVPLLSPQLTPREVELLVTPQQQDAAHSLSDVLKSRGLTVRQWAVSSSDWQAIYEKVASIARSKPKGSVALNVTGGTKIMAFAALQAIRDSGQQAYYLQSKTGELVSIEPWSAQPKSITSTLTLEEYFCAYGYTPEGPLERPDCHNYTSLFHELLHIASTTPRCFSHMNALTTAASQENNWTVPYGLGGLQGLMKPTKKLLSIFQNHGILTYQKEHVVFKDSAAVQMARGGWLELAVYQMLKGFAQDAACNVKVSRNSVLQSNKVSNEYDAVALINNHLYLVECKSSKNDKESKNLEIVYKQIAVAASISAMSNSCIVSVCPLGASNVKRATEQGCLVIEGNDLARLEELLGQWVQI